MGKYDELCNKIRTFNRFYTVKMDFLNSTYLGSKYTTAETRILFEIKIKKECTQSEIAKTLNIDKSYLSRIIRRFITKGFVQKTKSTKDKRAEIISLMEQGNSEADKLIDLTNKQITAQIMGLNSNECRKLSNALDTVILILEKGGSV
ncbi:MAG: MarR family winged helix-turn-helix transcriptional regulator [Candidatus Gastranaerophilales bacterium]|nr:MarR family winged helix-turn-helix transcriptional regulator [Candidatus Gastranaerophilales bacterium]